MTRRILLLCWLLTLAPLVILGLAALRLLSHEQERLAHRERAAASELAGTVAASLQLVTEEAEAGLLRALRDMPDADLPDSLRAWEQRNPLVRTAFLWIPGQGLALPDPSSGDTAALRFASRYEVFFESGMAGGPAPESSPDPGRQPTKTAVRPLRESRRQFQQWNKAPASGMAGGPAEGWTPWFSGQDFSLVGWIRNSAGVVRGVEMETMTLLAQLITVMPGELPPGLTLVLLNGEGQILHKAGAAAIEDAVRPEIAVPLDPLLPHWRLGIRLATGGGPARSSAAFWLVAGLMLAAFAAAILTSTVLLTREARRRQREARQKTSFVANVSHELKTPLTTIRMYAELLEDGRVAEPERRTAYLRTIIRETQRLARLVNNALDFSRIEQDHKQYCITRFDLAEAVTAVLDAHAPRLAEAGLALCRKLPDAPVEIQTDRDALEQCVLNLLDNAAKYAADGGAVEVVVCRDNGRAVIEVSDRGPGIPRGHEALLFQPFHRVDNSLTARHPGCGLGLGISRRLLRDLGGDLQYQPRAGGGASFTILLPAEGAGGAAQA
ncbi:MAG: HAMP domain-containing histidine kinase [Lentisphaerae bacterium]|nr:HAMP domain-containing histidine kinase [Lentisphaerota bacterium]